MQRFDAGQWALVLGGSSGFGLATATKLAAEGMSVCIVHRDRRGAMERIEQGFDQVRAHGHGFLSLNLDALSPEGIAATLTHLAEKAGPTGRVRVMLHSIAFGNLKAIAPLPTPEPAEAAAEQALAALAERLGVDRAQLDAAVAQSFSEGASALHRLLPTRPGVALMEDEDMARTVYAMGTSLLTWTQAVHKAGLFAADARVIGLTSEGNTVSWRGYAAVSAAKCALEAVSRAIAVEFGPHGIRSNIVQAGITDTPALRLIPGNLQMKASAELRNPLGRTTRPEDVADAICLLATDEAHWINGALIRVDGGEHVAS
jgi:NAD(P)-dependent dehydrogenase (short-subunit alcohol dehydrogenase family)